METIIKTMQSSTPSASVSALEDHVGFWLRFVSNHVSGEFARQVEQRGVSVSDWVAMREMYRHEQSGAAELVSALGMTKGAVSKIVTRLQKKGLVARAPGVVDKRAQHLMLTPAGRALVPELAAIADRNDASCFASLSVAQRQSLMGMMQQIVQDRQLRQVPTE
ncbi:MarR family winged helix-turn-helix transcriptional regulator [Massilia sp. CF038]|uniref:MarR family winged helix-turn-helix transcriptional regulator n=1 Tax=Massilia sp. CF038 TaxID=1881045 RepID=UPI0009152556|nr:MarR family transcriptional regulator [Massilia sp. CF038]SHH25647.1 DNA-binding transcriptional regulator, MarR family [Massilia sp. CF038]